MTIPDDTPRSQGRDDTRRAREGEGGTLPFFGQHNCRPIKLIDLHSMLAAASVASGNRVSGNLRTHRSRHPPRCVSCRKTETSARRLRPSREISHASSPPNGPMSRLETKARYANSKHGGSARTRYYKLYASLVLATPPLPRCRNRVVSYMLDNDSVQPSASNRIIKKKCAHARARVCDCSEETSK